MMDKQVLNPGVAPREMWSWALYDFANSGYTTVVITAVFNAYFVSVVAGNAPWATLAWTLTLGISYGLIVLTAPLVGAYADAWAAKKKLLIAATLGCVVFTAGLYFAGPSSLILSILLIAMSNFFYGTGENLVAAFLPEIARPKAIGKVSAWGWSLGYFGGLISLGLCLLYIDWAQGRGQSAAEFVPVTMALIAAFYGLAALPAFLWLRDRSVPQPHLQTKGSVRESFARLRDTFHHARRFRDLFRFLVCTLFYQAGIQAVIALAAIYAAQAMHFSTRETVLMIFVVNISAAIGAFAFGQVQDKLGHVATVALTLAGWIVMVVLAYFSSTRTMFWIAANLAGVCMGASQSAGRAIVGLLSPNDRRGEFYGLWGFAVKLSSIFGPITYGLTTSLTSGNHRLAMLFTGSYFVVGLLILGGVNMKRGRRAALRNV